MTLAVLTFLLCVIAILIFCSALFSGLETALFSLKKHQIRRLQEQHPALADFMTAFRENPRRVLNVLLLGGTLATVCALYLFLNHLLGGKWRPVPVKEKAVGALFAAGTTLAVVGQLPGLTISFAFAVVLFAILCTLNCLCIAFWERELDEAQGKTSLLTGWPAVARALKPLGFVLAAVALLLALVWNFAGPLWVCLAASALLLVWLRAAATLPRDNRTALADLVLLTPLIALLFSFR